MSTRFSPQYYGLVFGFRQSVEIDSCISVVDNQLVASEDRQFGFLFDKICKVYNKLDNALLTYHDGEIDKGCEYNGKHYHLLCELRGHPTRDQRWGRDCLAWAKARANVAFFAAQTAVNVASLSRHICQAPRVVLHYKGEKLVSDIGFTPPVNSSLQTIANTKANLKRDSAYYRIEFLTNLMAKYRTSDMPTIKRQCLQNQAEWEEFVECLSGSGFDVQYKKAADIYRTKQCSKTIKTLIQEEPQPEWSRHPYMSVERSLQIFDQWIRHQEFDKGTFIDQLYGVLERKYPKKNTFVLYGEPNSGKSYILRSLIPHYSYFGEVRGGSNNYTFLWQDCVDTGLIFIEEPMISPEVAEQFKLVMEGAITHVHVKMRGDAILQPTPVLITTNSLPWRWCSNEMAAFQARMFMFICKPAEFLKTETQQLNPGMWSVLFNKEKAQIQDAMEAYLADVESNDSTIVIIDSDSEDEMTQPPVRQSVIQWAPAIPRIPTPPLQQLIDMAAPTPTPVNSPQPECSKWWEHNNAQDWDELEQLLSNNDFNGKRQRENDDELQPAEKIQLSDDIFEEIFGCRPEEHLSNFCNVCGAVHIPPEQCPILLACVNSDLIMSDGGGR